MIVSTENTSFGQLIHIREAQQSERITDELVQQGLDEPSHWLSVLDGFVRLADDDGHEFLYRLGIYDPNTHTWPMSFRTGRKCGCCPEGVQNG